MNLKKTLVVTLSFLCTLLICAIYANADDAVNSVRHYAAVQENSDTKGEVSVDGKIVFRIKTSLNGKNPGMRAEAVAERLNTLFSQGINPQSVTYQFNKGDVVIYVGNVALITVDSQLAIANKTSRISIATAWVKNLRTALGANFTGKEVNKYLAAKTTVTLSSNLRVTGVQYGKASWYGGRWHGRRTASRGAFNRFGLTAAHRSLPFGTLVKVTNLHNGKQVIVVINDRGPFIKGRIIDLSQGAARILGMEGRGVASVKIEVLKK